MAHESIFYGLIDAGEKKERGELIHAHNRCIIESLPDTPSELISRQMFAFVEPPVAFRTQLIHFARSINYIEDCWPQFLNEFEGLIGRMCWYYVRLHISFDQNGGEYAYTWSADEVGQADLFADPPRPISSSEFSGGPREFPIV